MFFWHQSDFAQLENT